MGPTDDGDHPYGFVTPAMGWTYEKQGQVGYWHIPGWARYGFSARFITREGGHSSDPYRGRNISYGVGDRASVVAVNREKILESLPTSAPRVILTVQQVHGDAVATVEDYDIAEGEHGWLSGPKADAIIGSGCHVGLATMHADCLPVYLLDDVTGIFALVHVGWRGLVDGVIERTVEAMGTGYGSRPEDLRVALGPAIEHDVYEVDTTVLRRLTAQSWWRNVAYPARRGHLRLDLAGGAREALAMVGVPRARMITGAPGTHGNPRHFFSHRRDGLTGRCMALLLPLSGGECGPATDSRSCP